MRPLVALLLLASLSPAADPVPVADVDGQPLAANAERLVNALEFLGAPLPTDTATALKAATDARDAKAVQAVLDPRVLFVVSINPESRVKVARGPGAATIQQAGYVPVLVNVLVGGKPIRASKDSAKWCVGVIEQLWRARAREIAAAERPEAEATFQKALGMYRQIAAEANPE
jgi:hypothetical protein